MKPGLGSMHSRRDLRNLKASQREMLNLRIRNMRTIVAEREAPL